MSQNKITRVFAVLAFLALAITIAAAPAEARHRGYRGRIVGPGFGISPYAYWGSPFYAYGPFYGFRGPYGPYRGVQEAPQLNPAVAAALGVGAIDFDVKPRKADVYVDGKFVGKVRDFDGSPGYLWLREGAHTVTIYRGGYTTVEEEFSVEGGIVQAVKLRLLPGDSSPPPSPAKTPNGEVGATSASLTVF